MAMDSLPHMVLDDFKSWGILTPNFNKLFRAKGTAILISMGLIPRSLLRGSSFDDRNVYMKKFEKALFDDGAQNRNTKKSGE